MGQQPKLRVAVHSTAPPAFCASACSREKVRSTVDLFPLQIFRRDRLRVGRPLMRSREERRCSIMGPTQSRVSPSILQHTKIEWDNSLN